MSTRRSLLAFSVGITAIATLSGCVGQAPARPSAIPSETVAQPEPAPSLTRNPAEPDSMLWVRATATAANGAQLSLEGMVHRPVSYAYPGTQTINANMIDDCGATLTNAILAANAWSLTRMNTTAIPPVSSTVAWPDNARIDFRPLADNVYMSSRGIVQSDATTGELLCTQNKYLVGAGRGALFVGIPGDTIDLDHFNNGLLCARRCNAVGLQFRDHGPREWIRCRDRRVGESLRREQLLHRAHFGAFGLLVRRIQLSDLEDRRGDAAEVYC
jgi:hypothetical protein